EQATEVTWFRQGAHGYSSGAPRHLLASSTRLNRGCDSELSFFAVVDRSPHREPIDAWGEPLSISNAAFWKGEIRPFSELQASRLIRPPLVSVPRPNWRSRSLV